MTSIDPVGAVTLAVAKRFAQGFRTLYPKIAARSESRLKRAIVICTYRGACQADVIPGIYHVESQSNHRTHYTVDTNEKSCTCPDHGRAEQMQAENGEAPYICKHRLAIGLHLHGPEFIAAIKHREISTTTNIIPEPKPKRSFAIRYRGKTIPIDITKTELITDSVTKTKSAFVRALNGKPFNGYEHIFGYDYKSIMRNWTYVSSDAIFEITK